MIFYIKYLIFIFIAYFLAGIFFHKRFFSFFPAIQSKEKVSFFLDFFKGFFLISFLNLFSSFQFYQEPIYDIFCISAILLGYLFPIPISFLSKIQSEEDKLEEKRKAISILLGIFIYLFPFETSISLAMFFSINYFIKNKHITSMIITVLFPFLILMDSLKFYSYEQKLVYFVIGLIGSFFMIKSHKKYLKKNDKG